MKILRTGLLILSFVFAFSACAWDNPVYQTGLENETWELIGYSNRQPTEGTLAFLQFKDGQVSGNAGCNHYGGSYQINGDAITFNDLFHTEMACVTPEGVMDQEQIFLELLGSAQRFELVEGVLTIYSGPQDMLTFKTQQSTSVPPTLPPQQSNSIPATLATQVPDSIPTQPFIPPAGFKLYQDPMAGISIYIPQNWVVNGVNEGQIAVFQSYPQDKYVGGEAREPGDTKCDLTIHPLGNTTATELIEQWKADSLTTVVSEEEIMLQSGQPGYRLEVESMGKSISLVTVVSSRVVVLACFGELSLFDEIAYTIMANQ